MTVEEHQATIVDDFLVPSGLHAECSCGWVGDPASIEHLAMAEWASHVHVAEGWAEESGGKS